MIANKPHFIYVLKDENNNVFYVGKTSTPKKRFGRHLYHVNDGSTYPVHNKLRKVISIKGTTNGIYQLIEENIAEKDIDNREIFFIKHFKDLGCKLKNLTEGGEGGKGYTDEINKKAGLKRKGRKLSAETKEKMSKARIGMKFSKSHKDALKKARNNRSIPDEVGKKISKTNRGYINIKKFILLSPTGEQYTTETGLTDFCRQHNLSVQNLHKTINGERKHHKGWKIVGGA